MIWKYRRWSELERDDLHAMLRLRTDVFVVEQDCPYPELDGRDLNSVHVWACPDAKSAEMGAPAAACARIVCSEKEEISIGRVAVGKDHRGSGLGQSLMLHALQVVADAFGRKNIRISAQSHLQDFYAHFGFVAKGEPYLEDDIPHREMWRSADPAEAWAVALRHATQRLMDIPIVHGAEDVWGTGETLRHLILVAESMASLVHHQDPLKKGKRLNYVHHHAAAELVGALGSPRKFRVPDGLELPHTGAVTVDDEIRLESAVASCIQATTTWDLMAWDRTCFRHPFAGWMGGDGMMAFLVFHTLHHRRILQRLASAAND
ncbi:MAG: GNAT family N-acetyltransferase [Flavobacteriales bacterium]